MGCIEAHVVGHAAPEVGGTGDVVMGTAFGFFGLLRFVGQHRAVIDGMVFHHDAGNGNLRIGCVTTEVEDHLDAVRGVDTRQVGEVVNRFTSLEFLALGEEEVTVIGHVGELESETRKIIVGVDNHGEVVVLGSLQDNGVGGVDEELGLPLVGGGFRQREDVLGAVLYGLGIGNLTPAGGIPEAEGMVLVGGFPEVAVGVVLEAGELHGASLAGEDELPGDGTASVAGRRVPYQGHGAGIHALYIELGVLDEVVVGDVRERRSGGQVQEQVVTFHGEGISGLHRIYGNLIVGVMTGLAIGSIRHTDIHVHGTGFTGIESVRTFGIEGNTVVVHAKLCLFIGLGRPPSGSIADAFTAGHMTLGAVVDAPDTVAFRTSGNELNVLVEVDERIVDMEGFFHIVGSNTRSVHDLHPDFIVASVGENALQAIPGITVGIILRLAVVEEPNGNDTLGIYREGDLVGLLVYSDDRLIHGSGGRSLGLGRMMNRFLGAGSQGQNRREYIYESFHNQ